MGVKVVSYVNSFNNVLAHHCTYCVFHLMGSVCDEMLCNYFFKGTMLFWA